MDAFLAFSASMVFIEIVRILQERKGGRHGG